MVVKAREFQRSYWLMVGWKDSRVLCKLLPNRWPVKCPRWLLQVHCLRPRSHLRAFLASSTFLRIVFQVFHYLVRIKSFGCSDQTFEWLSQRPLFPTLLFLHLQASLQQWSRSWVRSFTQRPSKDLRRGRMLLVGYCSVKEVLHAWNAPSVFGSNIGEDSFERVSTWLDKV